MWARKKQSQIQIQKNESMLCQRGAPIITRHEPMLVQAFASTKASLVLMVYETGAPRSTSMCLDCSRHLGSRRPHRCRCCASPRHIRLEPMLVEASARSKARWYRWCARQVPQAAQTSRSHRCSCCASQVPRPTKGKSRCWSRHPRATRPHWC